VPPLLHPFQSLVIGRYGASCSRDRVEAIALLNEYPYRATDVRLVALVFTGETANCADYKMDAYCKATYRPRFMMERRIVEKLCLAEAEYFRDTGYLPPRHALETVKWGGNARGRGIVVVSATVLNPQFSTLLYISRGMHVHTGPRLFHRADHGA
jgi:hypothetical protein